MKITVKKSSLCDTRESRLRNTVDLNCGEHGLRSFSFLFMKHNTSHRYHFYERIWIPLLASSPTGTNMVGIQYCRL